MAKKAVRKSSRAGRGTFKDKKISMDRDYKEMLRDLAANPAVRYVAGGIATALLTKLATNLAQRYPELSNFIKDNLDNVEGRLGDFKNSLGENARH